MRLTQYWDQPAPPDEVDRLISTWRSDSNFKHEIFNRQTARDYIETHLGSETRIAFDKCRLPAMQADLFRYCSLYIGGGLYIDADIANHGGARRFFSRLSRGGGFSALLKRRFSGPEKGVLMYRSARKDGVLHHKITNDVMLATGTGSALFEAAIRTACSNIARQISQNVWLVTGPGVLNRLYKDEKTRGLFEPYHQVSAVKVKRHLGFHWQLDYKKGENDWRHGLRSGAGQSIFASGPEDSAS